MRTALVEDDVVRLLPETVTTLDVFAERERAEQSGESLPLESVRLLPPLEAPSIRDFLTFEAHIEGTARLHDPPRGVPPQWYEASAFYFRTHTLSSVRTTTSRSCLAVGSSTSSLRSPRSSVATAATLRQETEPVTSPGYAILNDSSARDLQLTEMQVGLGPVKAKDSAITLGPWIATADELVPYRRGGRLDLRIEAVVNGERIGGDEHGVVVRGPRGLRVTRHVDSCRGCPRHGHLRRRLSRRALGAKRRARDPPALAAGDVVRLTVEALGAIENRLVARGRADTHCEGTEALMARSPTCSRTTRPRSGSTNTRSVGITRADVEAELLRIGKTLEPLDIVLIRTGTDLKKVGYESRLLGYAATRRSFSSRAASG